MNSQEPVWDGIVWNATIGRFRLDCVNVRIRLGGVRPWALLGKFNSVQDLFLYLITDCLQSIAAYTSTEQLPLKYD